jgi:hypothetical protein
MSNYSHLASSHFEVIKRKKNHNALHFSRIHSYFDGLMSAWHVGQNELQPSTITLLDDPES